MAELLLGMACGCVSTWLYRDWQEQWKHRTYRALVSSLHGILIIAEQGEDVRPWLRKLAVVHDASPAPGEN